jgi:hypothetical protein
MEEEDLIDKPSRKGRPKGAKNKPKRGRPPKKKTVVKQKKSNVEDSDLNNSIPHPDSYEELIDVQLNKYLDESKLTDAGYNTCTDKIINQEPIDPSYYYRGSKHVPVAGAQYEFTADMVEELRKCKEDVIYFAENFFHIISLDRGKEKITLYEAQKRVLRSFVADRNVIVCSSRQIGKSTMLTVFSLWMVCFHDDYRAAIVANKETTAINIFKRIRMAYEQLPNYIKPGVKDYGKTGMTLGNDSSIVVSTTTATSIRGDSLNCVLLDEAAHIEPHLIEEFWSSVIPTVSSGKKSKILVVSTPKGVGNKFYEIYSGAESGKLKTWVHQRIDWWDFPGRDEAWKQSQIELLGSEEKFFQEYDNTFLDDAASAVGASVIDRFKKEKKDPIWSSDDGEYLVFEYPNPNKLYVIGVDVSEGIGRAASVAQILDVTDLQNIKQVAVYGSTKIEPYHFANKPNVIGSSWGMPPMLIERNNCGAQVIDALHYNHNYEKIVSYSKISTQEKYNRTRGMGVLSHTNIRSDGIQNMRYWVNHLQVVHINDPSTIAEFETFVRLPNGVFRKRNDKFFDDRIMALVWSLFILESEICQQYFEIVDYDTQHKPLYIKDNGVWEKLPETYELKDLSKTPKIIPKPSDYIEESPTTQISNNDSLIGNLKIDELYEEDLFDLLAQGYSFFNHGPSH